MATSGTDNITYDQNIFTGTRSVKDLTKYLLMRGVTDFGDLEQYNLYESGYSFLNVLALPVFIRNLLLVSEEYDTLIRSYAHMLEFEFRGFGGGLDNMTTDYGQLTNGINSINIINKVNKPSDSSFSATYQEKLGGLITKFHELYITGIKDPRTEVKTYHGLIGKTSANGYTIYARTLSDKIIEGAGEINTNTSDDAIKLDIADRDNTGNLGTTYNLTAMEAGFENEIFKFMYIVTDNTLLGLEKAVYLAAAQLTSVPFDIYTGEKGTYDFKDVSVEFNAYPVMCKQVNNVANALLQHIYLDTTWREWDFEYGSLSSAAGVGTSSGSIKPFYKRNSSNKQLTSNRVTADMGNNIHQDTYKK